MDAVKMVRKGHSMRSVARHFGYNVSTISKWVQRAPDDARRIIPTESSRPHSCPHALPQSTVDLIIALRLKHRRCAEVIHHEITEMGIAVSLSSVKRTLKRAGLLRPKGKRKKYHHSPKRPHVESPGDLVQLDTVHIHPLIGTKRFYIYTLLDVCSRWAHAWSVKSCLQGRRWSFFGKPRNKPPLSFRCSRQIMDQSSRHGSPVMQEYNTDILVCGNPMTMHISKDSTEPFKKSVCTTSNRHQRTIKKLLISGFRTTTMRERIFLSTSYLLLKCCQGADRKTYMLGCSIDLTQEDSCTRL